MTQSIKYVLLLLVLIGCQDKELAECKSTLTVQSLQAIEAARLLDECISTAQGYAETVETAQEIADASQAAADTAIKISKEFSHRLDQCVEALRECRSQ